MGAEQSILEKKGYVLQQQTSEKTTVATKGHDKYIIKEITINQESRNSDPGLLSEIELLKEISHPHIVSGKNSFEDQDIYYLVMEHCQGENLATKIRGMSQPPEESEILSWIVEICIALRTIHEKGLLHKHLTPETIFFNEFGTVYLREFGNIYENSNTTGSNQMEVLNYLAPDVFKKCGTYDAKSDIWSVGCILYELCTLKPAFSEMAIKLMSKVKGGPYPHLPDQFSPELCELLNNIFSEDCQSRPTASKILQSPFVIDCLYTKCDTTVKELLSKLVKLRAVADNLERVHEGTIIGSLAGGVIGAVGGVTSIVGLILAPFTLGASLVVSGIGVGLAVTGGITGGVSNITNVVNQSFDRKAFRSILKEFEKKISMVATWLQEISNSLHKLRNRCDSAVTSYTRNGKLTEQDLLKMGAGRVGRGACGIAEPFRHLQVKNIGNIAVQATRAVRIAEVATGVLSGLFVAVDIFFIAMDARELHNIRQAKMDKEKRATGSEISDFAPTSDQAAQVPKSQNQFPVRRMKIMEFVQSNRQTADKLQNTLDEFKSILENLERLDLK